MKRRDFVRAAASNAAIIGAAAGLKPLSAVANPRTAPASDLDWQPRVGPKPVVKGKKAVCASQHPVVTETMLQVMKDGGNAADAAVAGCLVQATVQLEMTNHTGTVEFLYWEAKTGKAYMLNSSGTLVPGLPAFRPIPSGLGVLNPFGAVPPMACIPGFMPGIGEIHKRFGTKSWSSLCQPAVRWAEEGHRVSSFEYAVLSEELPLYTYFQAGRELFTPDGFVPQVGDVFRNPKLAKTLAKLAADGPEYFTKGAWAQHFVDEANRLGWPIKMQHMTAIPPRWQEPLRYEHNGYEILQLSPPERQGVYTALVLGILGHLGYKSMGHYAESAESLYYMAHALRRAEFETGYLHDPHVFDVPVDLWLSNDYQKAAAEVLKRSRPKVDLTDHVRLTSGNPALIAAGIPTGAPDKAPAYKGSCELSIVDPQGNWVQMMNTLQSGGIPGAVVDGVPMVGSHAAFSMPAAISGWLTGGGRIKSVIGNTIVLKNGKPVLSLGTPGNVHCTIPQVLSSIIDHGMDPYEASTLPRMLPLRDDYVLEIESRVPPQVFKDLTKMGIKVRALEMHDYHMGSFQISWRDEKTGLLNGSADPRRAGKADGF
jgi:gamma-glutamyltranspeptidase/glutathione hydrolase